MEEAILNFSKQFDWEPEIINREQLVKKDKFIVVGMGGSHLAAWLLKRDNPNLDLLIHRDYGLPRVPEYFLKDSLIVLSSYSGNTEEVLDVANLAKERGLSLAVISAGGKLIDFAKENSIPYIVMPETGIEPRMAIGFAMTSIVRLMGDSSLEEKIRAVGSKIDPSKNKEMSIEEAKLLRDKKIFVYSSTLNLPIAYNWKIKFNETAKLPASFNVFPELCHNELSGFDVAPKSESVSLNSHIVMLEDDEDHERIKKRMDIMRDVCAEKNIGVSRIKIDGENSIEKAFNSILLAEWICLNLADYYGVPDAKTPLIADFKNRMSR